MADTDQKAPTAQGASGALLARKVASRVYGSLAIFLGLVALIYGVLAIAARSTGSTYGGMIENPGAVPAAWGPYLLTISIVTIVLGLLIYRQHVLAAISLLVFTVGTDVLSYFIPALNDDGVATINSSDMAIEVLYVFLTAIVVIADRAMRRVPA